MPSTMPGFLLLSGLLMFLASLFNKPIKYKEVELPVLSARNRGIVRWLGAAFMVVSFLLYGFVDNPGTRLPLPP